MATSNSADVVVQIRRTSEDGKRVSLVASFQNDGPEPAQNKAFVWFLKHTPYSWDHATRYEGYSIVEVWGDGSEHVIS